MLPLGAVEEVSEGAESVPGVGVRLQENVEEVELEADVDQVQELRHQVPIQSLALRFASSEAADSHGGDEEGRVGQVEEEEESVGLDFLPKEAAVKAEGILKSSYHPSPANIQRRQGGMNLEMDGEGSDVGLLIVRLHILLIQGELDNVMDLDPCRWLWLLLD